MTTHDAAQVVHAGRGDTDRAVRAWLEELGMTYDQLAAEARAGSFRSEEARLAWFVISDSEGDA